MRSAIFSGMSAGDRIGSEIELAPKFGVSRLAMRDAVRALRTLGLIEVRMGTQGGLFVAHSDARHLGEAFAVQIHQMGVDWAEMTEALASLEPAIAALAAARRPDEDLVVLQDLVDQQRACADDRDAFHRKTSDFHVAIARAAGNRALLVAEQAFRLNLNNRFPPGDFAEVTKSVIAAHVAILEAIKARDADLAAKVMAAHSSELCPGQPKDLPPRPGQAAQAAANI
jgi:GntR family transcriptional regulator, transcriptional repressor for pyruvate dehydrogenase complex